MINIVEIIDRLKNSGGLKADKQVAEIFGLSKQDFSNRKKAGTLLPLVVEWGISNEVDLHWLITGEAHIDADLLEEAVTWTENYLKIRKQKLPLKKKTKFISLYYQHFKENGEAITEKEMDKYLRLVS